MKKSLSEALSNLVRGYECRSYQSSVMEAMDLAELKEELHDRLKFAYHHLPADAQGFIDRAKSASTMHYALTCITAAAAGLLTSHEIDREVNESITSSVTAQHDSQANASRAYYPHLLAEVEKLTRYDLDSSDCDSCGQDCGADMVAYPDGDYVKLEDVLRILGGQ